MLVLREVRGWSVSAHLGLAGLALVVTVNAMRSWPRRTTGVLLKTLALAGLGLLFCCNIAPRFYRRG